MSAGINRSDRFFGPNFLAVDDDRIFLAELRPDLLDRSAHSFLILFVGEIHKRCVFITIAGRRVEGSVVAIDFDMTRAVRTLRDKIGRIAQQFGLGNIIRKFRAQKSFV